MWKAACLISWFSATFAVAAQPSEQRPAADDYNYVIGTQTFAPLYQFTDRPKLVETAQAILDMGSNVLKFGVGKVQYYDHNGETLRNVPAANPDVHNLTDLFRLEPAHRQVLDMPFPYYVIWTYPFAGWVQGHLTDPFAKPMSDEASKQEYEELRDLTRYLLKTYSGSGKTFFLGHWEGDWMILGKFDPSLDPSEDKIKNMAAWLNVRQKAVDDAKRDTPHHDVQVFHYTEVNLVYKSLHGRKSVASDVLPLTNVDYVSYSSYDTVLLPEGDIATDLPQALDYIESKLPPKPGIEGKRVFVGEYGFPKKQFGADAQAEKSRQVMKAAVGWGCPFVLYWEMYNNEMHDGVQDGFWLIDEKGEKQPAYYLHERFCRRLRRFVADFEQQHGRAPSESEFRREALLQLDQIRWNEATDERNQNSPANSDEEASLPSSSPTFRAAPAPRG